MNRITFLIAIVVAASAAVFAGNEPNADTAMQQCANVAIATCGQGEVCCVCLVGDPQACSFSCRGLDGTCAPCPACGPTDHSNQDYVVYWIAPGIAWVIGPISGLYIDGQFFPAGSGSLNR